MWSCRHLLHLFITFWRINQRVKFCWFTSWQILHTLWPFLSTNPQVSTHIPSRWLNQFMSSPINIKLLTKSWKMLLKVGSSFPLHSEAIKYFSKFLQPNNDPIMPSAKPTASNSDRVYTAPRLQSDFSCQQAVCFNAAISTFSTIMGVGVQCYHPPISAVNDKSKNP